MSPPSPGTGYLNVPPSRDGGLGHGVDKKPRIVLRRTDAVGRNVLPEESVTAAVIEHSRRLGGMMMGVVGCGGSRWPVRVGMRWGWRPPDRAVS